MDDFDEVVFRNRRLDSTGEKIYKHLKAIYRSAELAKQGIPAGTDITPLINIQNEAVYAAVALIFDND